MRIAELRTYVVGNPPPGFGGRYFVFLQLVTDDGVVGVGEVYAATFHPTVVERMIHDVLFDLWKIGYLVISFDRGEIFLAGEAADWGEGLA